MKIRIIGTAEECAVAQRYYESLRDHAATKYVSVSSFYPCRGSADLYRVYIEIEYYDGIRAEQSDGAETSDNRTIDEAYVGRKGLTRRKRYGK